MALRHINVSNPPGRIVSYNTPDTCSLIDLIPSRDQPADERFTSRETLGELIAALKKMKDPDAFDIIRMVVQNRKQEEIADALGITQSVISRKIRKIYVAIQQAVQY